MWVPLGCLLTATEKSARALLAANKLGPPAALLCVSGGLT
jgi:hypothetical protein